MNKLIEINDNVIENDLFKEEINNLNKEKNKINKELKNKEKYFLSLYEDLKKELIDEEQYMFLKTKYKDESDKLTNRLKIIEENISFIKKQQNKLKDKKTLFNKYKKTEKLNIEIINDFIDKIIIGNLDEKTNKRKIHIIWNFIN